MQSLNVGRWKAWGLVGAAAAILLGRGFAFAGSGGEGSDKKTDGQAAAGAAAEGTTRSNRAWKEKGTIELPGWLPGSVAYSADAMTLVAGGTEGKVAAFDAGNRNPKWKADVGGSFAAVAFSSDRKAVLATFTDGVRFLDAATGEAGPAMEAKESRPMAIGVFPDRLHRNEGRSYIQHKIAFGNARDYVVKDWIEGAEPGTIEINTVKVGKEPADPDAVPLAVDPAGRSVIMTGPIHSDTGKNVLWAYVAGNYEEGSPGNRLMEGHEAAVVSAAWSKDGKVAVTGDAGGRVIVWDAKAMKESQRLEFGGRVAALALTGKGEQIAAAVIGKTAEFYVWETAKPQSERKPIHVDAADFAGSIRAGLAFSPDDKQLAGCASNLVWLSRSGRLIGLVHVWEAEGK